MINLKNENEMWMVRAGSDSFLIENFIQHNIVALGWDVESFKNKTIDEIKSLIQERYAYKSKSIITRYTNHVILFVNTINIGDYVITYDQFSKVYFLGEITSDYYYEDIIHKEHPTYDGGYYNHVRNVDWFGIFQKEQIEEQHRKKLNYHSSIFKINDDIKQNILNIVDENAKNDFE